jgi:lantibiotic biosynthesis protein
MSALLVASSQEAVNAGDFKLFVKGGAGPSGARLIGRFCHVDPAFEDATRKHLAEEEALQPDAVFAEIVYLPEGRVGNVLCRPVLREYEITCMGRSGAAADRQIPLSDLLISVATDGAILLYSRRLGRQVLPRLTNAHGFLNPKLSAVYRFLTYLQNQGGGGIPPFRWGPLDVFDDLPRVRCGRHILAAARWKISREDVQQLDTPDRYDAFAALQRLRARRGLPRWVVLIEVDNALPADLDNPLSVDALVHVMKRAQQCVLAEMCPGPDDLCVTGPEGRFCHELLIPFVKERPRAHTDTSPAVTPVERAIAAAKTPVPASVRSFPPGSEWLYLKVYGGGSALDDALTTSVSSLLTQIAPARRLSKWFFLRYGDPHQHLRIRFQGSPHWLVAELLPLIHRTLAPLCQRGTIWKVEIGTYEREVERYGGPDSMLFAEDIFCADSDAVVEILRTLEGDEGAEARWRIALLGVHRLFDDCGVAADVRRDVMARARDSFLHEFRVGSQGKSQLSDRFRNQRHAIDALMHADGRGDDAMAIARAVFDRRSTRIAQAVTQLESLARRGTLHVPISELAISFSHMHVNRMIRASGRAHELILYDFLLKWYDARLARERQTHSATATVAHEAVATPRALVSPLE